MYSMNNCELVTHSSSKNSEHVSPTRRAGLTKLRGAWFGIPRSGNQALARSPSGAFAFQSHTLQGELANGPMSGPHPYTDCASLMTPAQWRSVATMKTGESTLIVSLTELIGA